MTLIELDHLDVTFTAGSTSVQALKGIDLSIEAGELTAIVGRSGSGKSTLSNILGLLLTPTAGTYQLKGRQVSQLKAAERARFRSQHFGFVFQRYQLLPRLTALQNVCLPLIYNRHQKPSRQEAVDMGRERLDQVGLSHRAMSRSNTLSGGEQQRVAIARAMINSPDIILADEPTGALDTVNADMVTDLLLTLNADHGVTVLIVTHDHGLAARCSHQINLSDGELTEDDVGTDKSFLETAKV